MCRFFLFPHKKQKALECSVEKVKFNPCHYEQSEAISGVKPYIGVESEIATVAAQPRNDFMKACLLVLG